MELETGYYRDSLKSYMTIRCPEKAEESDYRFRMASANHIDGILPCSLRMIDDSIYLYYEITARQKLSHMYADKRMDASDLQRLLSELAAAGKELSRYLLDAADLILEADKVYYDFSENRYYFTFCPGLSEKASAGGNRGLYVFLAEKIDAGDREAASAAFQLDAMSEMPEFVFTEKILKQLFGDRMQIPEDASPGEESIPTEAETDWGSGFYSAGTMDDAYVTPPEMPEREKEGAAGGEAVLKRPFSVKYLLPAGLLVLSGLLAGAGRFLDLPVRTLRLFTAGAMAAGASALLLLVLALTERIKGFRAGKKEEAAEKAEPEMSLLPPGEFDLWQKEGGNETGPVQTVFVPGISEKEGLRLYGNGRARGCTIELDDLPHTVGTSADFADVLIDDRSVSRMHARISEDRSGNPLITDLNSTNGTWINGIRLQPEESVPVGKGDVIRFGEAEFCCR